MVVALPVLHVMGVRLRVRPIGEHAQDTAAAVRRAWDWCLVDDPGGAMEQIDICVSSAPTPARVWGTTVNEVMHRLSTVVTQEAVRQNFGRLMMFHAAALADKNTGLTAVLVAPSGTGKTTAARLLGRELGYLSDETAAIELTGEVLAYPKPLSIVTAAWTKEQLSPTELRLLRPPDRCRLGALLLLDRDPSFAARPEARRLDMLTALARLGPEISALGSHEKPLHRLAGVIQVAGGVHEVRYREAEDLAPVVKELLDRSTE